MARMNTEQTHTQQPLPCPFCGGQPSEDDIRGSDETGETYGYFSIECPNCRGGSNGRFCGVHADTQEQARDAWNTRSLPAAAIQQARDILSRLATETQGLRAHYKTASESERPMIEDLAHAALAALNPTTK